MVNIKLLVERFMDEAALTPGADINEIMMGFYLAGGSWTKFKNGQDAEQTVTARKKMVDAEVYNDQLGRAKVMAQEIINWGKANGYDDQIQAVWWTARPGILTKAMGRAIDSKKNPTDILLDFGNGKFLGVSAKSTKGSGDIGFKNPGMGTLGTALSIDFGALIKHIEQDMVEKYKLPAGIKIRKAFIRSDPKIQAKTIEAGAKMLNILREALLKKLKSMDQDSLRKHVISGWLDAEASDPYYVKVTGHGRKGSFTADVSDPMNNDKFKAISSGKINAVPVGSDSVGITADNKKILKMRFKFESEKLASSIKLSGDPWSGEAQAEPTPEVAPQKQTSGWFQKSDQNKPGYRKNINFVQEDMNAIDNFDYQPGDLPPVTHNEKDRLDPSMQRVVSF